MKRIAIIDGGHDSYQCECDLFEKNGYTLDIFEGPLHDRRGKQAFAKGAVGILVRYTLIDHEFLEELPELKAVVRYGVGYDNIDVEAATHHGIKVANVQGYANHSVSDHAIALMYACARALVPGQQALRSHFREPPIANIFEFHDKTLGIIGLGRIGGTLCQKVKNSFERIVAADPYIPDQRFVALGAIKVDLPTLLTESHVITLHCNLTDETTHMIDQEAFNTMRQTPILINTARGDVIDERALQVGLEEKIIHSAGLDVYHNEPPHRDLDIVLNRPNVLSTGHYAWYSDRASVELHTRAALNLINLLQGDIPEDCLNP